MEGGPGFSLCCSFRPPASWKHSAHLFVLSGKGSVQSPQTHQWSVDLPPGLAAMPTQKEQRLSMGSAARWAVGDARELCAPGQVSASPHLPFTHPEGAKDIGARDPLSTALPAWDTGLVLGPWGKGAEWGQEAQRQKAGMESGNRVQSILQCPVLQERVGNQTPVEFPPVPDHQV